MTSRPLKERVPKRIRLRLRRIVYRLRSLFYLGDRVLCPWCNGRFRTFLRTGLKVAPSLNTFCPRCGCYERHRLLWLYFTHKTRLFEDRLTVLHVAPEDGVRKVLQSRTNLTYITADLDSPLALVRMDITDMPFRDGSFDVIICNHVLEHIADDRKAMSELLRVLRPGGWAVLMVPLAGSRQETLEDPSITTPEERKRHYQEPDHVRLYGRDYIDRLAAVGFTVTVDRYGAEIDEATVARYGIHPPEEIYIGTKAPGPRNQ